MKAFKYNMFERLELPQIILSTKHHKHLGAITNIDINSINASFNFNSSQEISFDVYKEMDREIDGKIVRVECELWDSIIDLKYIFIPDYQEYYSISVSIDEDNKTVKHIVGTSACEYELSHRKLYNFECNTEADIMRDDYVPTIFFNENYAEASLLHRVLKDKCPDYKIGHVDESIAIKQRVFSANDQDIYSFLTNDVATELECVFMFDSVNRVISVYAIEEYGENTGVYISPENYADSITVEGDIDNVFNCLKIEGGDELMTATVANINPNGSNYIYHFSEDMLNDMPEELVNKIASYNSLSTSLQPSYEEYTEKIYELIDEELYLTSEMMPEVTTPETSASEEVVNLVKQLKTVEVQNINSLSNASADLAIKGMAQVIVDPRYNIKIDSSTLSSASNNKRTWSGIITITNKGDEEDTATTEQFSVIIKSDDYEAYLYQKIQKALDRDDSVFYTIFEIEDIDEFKTELKKYSLNRLKSFESSYQTCLDVLIEQGVTTDTTELYGVNLYETMYKPYYDRIIAIQEEMVIREGEIKTVQDEYSEYEELRRDIQKQLNFKEYIGNDLWVIFSHYRLESTYKNDNYISEGLSNSELIRLSSELFEIGQEEAIKASELQYSLTASLNNLLNTKEFKPFKDKIDIGNWINLEADEKIYKLRLINLGINYGSLDKITVSFADVFRVKQLGVVEDTKAILEQAKSMANSYDYVAHQASQGSNADANVKNWLEEGWDSAISYIKNNVDEEIIFDKHGLWAKSKDELTDSYLPEQLRITHNLLVFSDDAFLTCKTALGKHDYYYYNKATEKFDRNTGYGLSCEFVTSGYIYGSQIIGGDIYSSNYSVTDKTGTRFGLNDEIVQIGGDALTFNRTDGLSIKGKVTATSGSFTGEVTATTITTSNGTIGQFNLGSALYSGTESLTSTIPGIYIGINGIKSCLNKDYYTIINNGKITVRGVGVDSDNKSYNMQASLVGGQLKIIDIDTSTNFTTIQGHMMELNSSKHNSNSKIFPYGINITNTNNNSKITIGSTSIVIKNIDDSKYIYSSLDGIIYRNIQRIDVINTYFSHYVGSNYSKQFKIMNNEELAYPDCDASIYGKTQIGKDLYVHGTLFSSDGNVQTSDRDLKNSIESLNLSESSNFIYSLNPVKYKYNKNSSNRYHHGFIAQEVKESMGENDWGVYIDETYSGMIDNKLCDKDGNVIEENKAHKALRYDELLADIVATIQSQNQRIIELENEVRKLNG